MAGMTLEKLRAAGGIVSREPVRKSITWTRMNDEGEQVSDTFDIFVMRQSLGSFMDLQRPDDRERAALALSKSLMLENEKGKLEFISYDDAYQLDPELSAVILLAVGEVNGGAAKNSPQPTSSSANSSSTESAAAP